MGVGLIWVWVWVWVWELEWLPELCGCLGVGIGGFMWIWMCGYLGVDVCEVGPVFGRLRVRRYVGVDM